MQYDSFVKAFNPEPATETHAASRTLDSIFEAVEDAGNLAAKLILLSRHDEQVISLLHDLIGDLCVVRVGTQLLQQREANDAGCKVADSAEGNMLGR